MKNEIIKLRAEGKTYDQIKEILGCSKATISYHCGEGQKEKTRNRTKLIRLNVLNRRVETFRSRRKKNITECIRKYQKRIPSKNGKYIDTSIQKTFTWKDIINKFGEQTECYLTGRVINLLLDEDYCFDHIIPVAKGGSNSIDNLGVLSSDVNKVKSDLSVDELSNICISILQKQGYKITK